MNKKNDKKGSMRKRRIRKITERNEKVKRKE